MKIAVMGCKGQLGSALQSVLRQEDLVCVDIEDLDITREGAVTDFVNQGGFDYVINAAAYTRVDDAETHEADAYRVNADGPRNLARATGKRGIPLIHVSTDYVFDGLAGRAYDESDTPNPLSAYGRTKLAGEEEVRAGNARHYIVRTAWLYHTVGANFPKTILRLAEKGPLRVVDDQHGSPTYAPHLAEAIARLIRENRAFGIYHLAGSGGTSWFELTKKLVSLMGMKVSVTPVKTAAFPRPARRPPYAVLETKQNPPVLLPPWTEGLREFVSEIKKEK